MSMLGATADRSSHIEREYRVMRNGIISLLGLSEDVSNIELMSAVLYSKLELDQLRAEKIPQPEDLSGGIALQSADENFGSQQIKFDFETRAGDCLADLLPTPEPASVN